MRVTKPYYLTVRQFVDGQYASGAQSRYISHPKYADMPSRFVRGFELLQKDLLTLFEYIELSDLCRDVYSFRTFELLLRTCTEVEANCKAILKANTFALKEERYWKMSDYFRINSSHFLSDYRVLMPFWDGVENVRQPFRDWSGTSFQQLDWYDAYNKAKHDRANNLRYASFNNLVDAFSGLVVLLSAQFMNNDFKLGASTITDEGPNDGYDDALGGYYRVRYPSGIPKDKCYDFDWQTLNTQKGIPFQKYNYDSVTSNP